MTDKQALRKAAIAATGGKWVFSRSGVNSNVQAPIELQKGGRALVVLCKLNNAGWSGQIQTENNAKFIAAANPATVLALLDELEALQSFRTAFNEWHDKTEWVQGDKRFDVIKPWGKHRADVLKLYIDHLESKLEAAEKRIAELEARAVKLPPTIWYDCDGESQEIAVLEKRLVEKAVSDAGITIAAGINMEAE
ncbi:ead/Ea22-like family protein [Citrobacter koseri]|uniref:ead/Ea22-like family protein n=1 Tax=Citrobacter koseri TaxID=545 RepID=UPI00294303FB|nr:ead/Ea22-like family protein [Citrobacter koseri]WOJ29046.1 ead/Ea22-like family protein [Citrobacter koseri]WOJ37539.1 ead/Ea22-like family protein [Citrobacter koseri]